MGKMKEVVLEAGGILEKRIGTDLETAMEIVMNIGTLDYWMDYIRRYKEET